MDTIKYIAKRLVMALFILFGVSIIIYALARMMPTDFVDNQYSSAIAQGTMTQEDVDRIKDLYGLSMPDAFLTVEIDDENNEFSGKKFVKATKEETHYDYELGLLKLEDFYKGSYDYKNYRLILEDDGKYGIYLVESAGASVDGETEGENTDDVIVTLEETLILKQSGSYQINEEGSITFGASAASCTYRVASFWDKAGAILNGYFSWLSNMLKGDFGMSFKYKKPVLTVIWQNMDVSFMIAFVATILQFLIAIPLGIKAARNQYGVVDYTVSILSMAGISLPTFFLAAIVIRVFAVELGWFEVGGLVSGSLPVDATWFQQATDILWHMVLPMTVLVILSIGSLMRYTRTNTLEVLNADYIRTARAKGLSENVVIYKHAFRNTMIPLVTMFAGILPSLFSGAMITETVFSIPGIGKLAYDALIVADVPFIMGYNMFMAILTVIGTLLSDLMYAVVDPRVKLGK
jgi:peptide/nickel transport system permease protein